MGVSFCSEPVIIDTETEMAEFTNTPRLALIQAYWGGDSVYIIPRKHLPAFMEQCRNARLVFHNAPFDVDVLCRELNNVNYFHPWIDASKIKDTQIMWKLVHLATNGYVPRRSSLKYLAEHLFQIELEKDGEVRHNFGQFLETDETQIPQEFINYACKDVLLTYKLYKYLDMQTGTLGDRRELSQPIQVAGAIALNRIYKRGIGFDLDAKENYIQKSGKQLEKLADKLSVYGWARGIPGSKEAYERAIQWLGINLPKTESGDISSKEEDLLKYKEKHEFIRSYLDFHALEKTRSFVANISARRVHPRYNLLMNTGRTSCTGSKEGACNIQQLPREGKIRGMFVPKEGHSFIITDYSAIELSALAQVTYRQFGESKMRDLINSGRDLHKYAASQIYKIPEHEVDKSQRLLAKILNFGLGANMSHNTFVEYAKGYGVKLTSDEAYKLKNAWVKIFPEMKKYWDLGGEFGTKYTHTTLTGRVRADCTYTAYLNTGFQGLAADGIKIAMYYLDFQGVDVVAMIHDELVSEVPNSLVDKYVAIQENIMIKGMRQVIPDVEVKVETQIAKQYCK